MGAELPHRAGTARQALLPATAYLLLAGGVVCVLVAPCMAGPAAVAELATLGSAFFIASSCFLGEVVLLRVQMETPPARPGSPEAHPEAEPTAAESSDAAWIGAQRQRFHDYWAHVDWAGEWLPIGIALGGGLIGSILAVARWHDAGGGAAPPTQQQVLGCAMIVVAFPLSWLNRLLARRDARSDPAASQLESLLRVPLVTSAGLGLSSLIRSQGYRWPFLIDRAAIVLVVLVGAEIVLRSAARLFLPTPPFPQRRSPAASAVARLIAPRWPRLGALGSGIRQQFGIDLSRSWALAFLLRASLPAILGLCLFGWSLTGVTALGIDQRAVYERFGVPTAVVGPGLHAHLPWPFGLMRRVELGVVHEIPIVFAADGRGAALASAGAESAPPSTGAEAVPPASADRLWDAPHPFEASYLIASASNGQQGFQIVNIDLRIVYRTSLSDAGALAAAYGVADPEAAIRAAAGRMLVQHFSRYTLTDVLGENRASFVDSFREQLQQRLDQLGTGTDVIAVVVEAIHPPPEAARAFRNVQAAELRAGALVSRSRGEAYLALGSSRQQSAAALDGARAAAAEQVDQAQAAFALFDGDHRAYLRGGRVVLMERWLSHLRRDMVRAPLVVVDHRLEGTEAPTVDLRPFQASDAPIVPVE